MSMIPEEPQDDPRRSIGGNLPPSPLETLVAAQRELLTTSLEERRDYIIERANRKLITDRETVGQAGDIIRNSDQFMDPILSDALELRRPFREAADAAKGVVDGFLDPLLYAISQLRERLEAWGKEEDQRIARQRDEQAAFFNMPTHLTVDGEKYPLQTPMSEQELMDEMGIHPVGSVRQGAEEAHRAATSLKPARRRAVVGDLGAKVFATDVKIYTVEDVHAVPDHILNSKTVHDAIISVAKSLAKHTPEIPGIKVDTETGTRVK